MGVSTNAILFYGYCWDEEGQTPWEIDPDYSADVEPDYEDDGKAPCLVDTHCSASCPMPYVAVRASVKISFRGDPTEVASLITDPSWDAALADFCKTLKIKTTKKKPAWWLVSDWSE